MGKSPVTVRGGVNAGYWKEGSVKGSHKEYYTEISHDPIKLGKMPIYASWAVTNATTMVIDGTIRSMPYWGARFPL